ncbi:hypothetical protein [Williamsia sp.]|nr:hypothetical protein [Williamsia sp.]MBJ7291242.1 hypothetical protein [Williamsia sp.]
MDPLSNPLQVCDDADLLEQQAELQADPAGLEEYPYTDHDDPIAGGDRDD